MDQIHGRWLTSRTWPKQRKDLLILLQRLLEELCWELPWMFKIPSLVFGDPVHQPTIFFSLISRAAESDTKKRVFASELFDMVERIHEYLLTRDIKTCEDGELRNHLFYCQQVEEYLLLKHAISKDDIGLLRHATAWAMVMFHGTRKHNYQLETFVYVLDD